MSVGRHLGCGEVRGKVPEVIALDEAQGDHDGCMRLGMGLQRVLKQR